MSLASGQMRSDAAAKVVVVTGQVSVLHDRAPWALAVGDTVQPKQIIVTGPDGFARLQVSDGSTFQVFPNSQVVFRANPPNWRDLLDVVIGRVKVEIQKLGNQPNPNSVHTPTAVISVRGTIFDVVVEEESENTFVSVDEGQVQVRNLHVPGEKLLNAGESIWVYKNLPLARTVDKGSVAQGALRAAAQAIYEIMLRGSRGGSGAGPGGSIPSPGGAQGDTDKPAPPPDLPPPPPPPPQ
ncbi:MAG: FecR domain-containing protein [Bryobacteraceae bacterium]